MLLVYVYTNMKPNVNNNSGHVIYCGKCINIKHLKFIYWFYVDFTVKYTVYNDNI